MKITIVIIAILALSVPSIFAFEWQTFTNSNDITALSYGHNAIWASTTGGVLRVDADDLDNVRKFVNTDGLGGIYINTIAADQNYVWAGSINGRLSRYEPSSNQWKQFLFVDRDGAPLVINDIYPDGDLLWVATNIGLSLFDVERHGGEIKETYRGFGDIPSGTGVEAVTIYNDTVWAVTNMGLAFASKDDPNLLDFTHWESADITTLSGLPTDDLTEITVYSSAIWIIGQEYAIEILKNGNQISVGEILETDNDINSVHVISSSLYLGSQSGILLEYSDGAIDTVESLDADSIVSAITDINGQPVVGTSGEGIVINQGQTWTTAGTTGPVENEIVDITQSSDGRIWMIHNSGNVSIYDNGQWNNIRLPRGDLLSIEDDSDGNVWVGRFGGDVYRISPAMEIDSFDNNNSSLIGNNDNLPSSLGYIVIPDMHFDANGIMWFACFRGHVKRPISFYSPEQDQWSYYTESGFLTESRIQTIFSYDRSLWAGFENDGLYRIEYFDDPFDPAGLEFTHYTRQSNLPSENVRIVTADINGKIWVGSDMGLAGIEPDSTPFFGRLQLPENVGPQINDILFDARNNMWVAASNGLAFRESGGFEFEDFSAANSDLISDNINSIHIDDELRLWIATDRGLSLLSYDIGEVTDNVEEVFAYPNPYIITDQNERVFFNYIDEVEIEIFSLDGRKIKTILSNSGWDGTNESGDKVASGMYLFYIRDDNTGESYTGKIALIRK